MKKILMADNKMGNRLNFLVRHFVNPLLLWFHLMKAEGRGQKAEVRESGVCPKGIPSEKSGECGSRISLKKTEGRGQKAEGRPKEIQLEKGIQFCHPLLWRGAQRAGWLKSQRRFVLLNDFEQMSAPLWSLLYRLTLRKRFTFGVFLHDSDRDNYPPTPRISAWCMKQMMKSMQLALYHGVLPQKSYYQTRTGLTYLKVEHGLYTLPDANQELKNELKQFTTQFTHTLGIIGHIRLEKNYSLVMQAIKELPNFALIVAGSASNSNVDIELLKQEAKILGISDRVVWINRYLSEGEMRSVIESCKTIALYYSSTFSAQSGILNQVAPLRKTVIVSDLPNALTNTVRKYNLGTICKADDLSALLETLKTIETTRIDPQWDAFFADVDWNKQVEVVLENVLPPRR